MGGGWVSTRPQIVNGITLRRGDAYSGPGYDDPHLQPEGAFIWRSLHDEGGQSGSYISSARGYGGWARSRPEQVAPVVVDRDPLRGRDIVDDRATTALLNAAFDKRAEAQRKPQRDPAAEYEATCRRQGMNPHFGVEKAPGRKAPKAAPPVATLEELRADRELAEKAGDLEVMAKIDAAIEAQR